MPVTRPQAAEAASGANRHGATGTEPASSLPSHALALADVVGALENADIPRLRAALDAADPALLNHVGPWRWYDYDARPDNQSSYNNQRSYNGECFFDTRYMVELMGDYPQTLLSCFTVALVQRCGERNGESPPASPTNPADHASFADLTGEQQEASRRCYENQLEQAREARESRRAHREMHGPIDWWSSKDKGTWLKVYEVLVNHPKIDVNVGRTQEEVEAMSQTWSFLPEEDRPALPTIMHMEPASLEDDTQTAWDYIFQHSHHEEVETNKVFHGQLLSILAATGKLAVEHEVKRWQDADYEIEELGNHLESALAWVNYRKCSDPLWKLMEDPRHLPHARAVLRERKTRPDLGWVSDELADELLIALTYTQAVRVTVRVRRIARVHIFLARWSADARLASYAPDGAGAKRARQSFDAITTAAGW